MVEYQKNDIVMLGESKFETVKGQLWFKDNAFEITAIKDDGMVLLMELDELVSRHDLLPMPINKKRAGNVYYDTIIAASVVGPDDEIPVHSRDYTYFMDAFKKVTEEDGTTLYELVDQQGFKYVHEVQHWLRERYGADDLKIHHQIITVAEAQCRNLWNLRDSLLESGVSSYQFLYEMANMLYLRWMAFNDTKAMESWRDLELTIGDELIEKYQKVIGCIQQETRIYSAPILSQAISVVSKCVNEVNIADVFDLMLQENSKMKDGGAMQNYTPLIVSQLLVKLMKPQLGERWHDPAAGFAGFLVEINDYLRRNNESYSLLDQKEKVFQVTEALTGEEIQKDIAQIGFCNMRFHGIRSDIKNGDALKETNYLLYDGIICEPPMPFFSLAGSTNSEKTKNRQTDFVELILHSLSLQPSSRAAILLPDIFLYRNSSEYRQVRRHLFEDYNLHTILRFPKGVYPRSVNLSMCALFLQQGRSKDGKVLIYDMQAQNLKPEKLQNISAFNGFIKTYNNRMADKQSRFVTLDDLRHGDYIVTFGKKDHAEDLQIDTTEHYLLEANKIVKEIRSLLVRIEKEVQ